MNDEKNITRGGLSGKMGGFRQDPPPSVWEGVASGLRGKRSGRKLFIFLGVAAGLALAVTVGITLYTDPVPGSIATIEESGTSQSPFAETTEKQASEAESLSSENEAIVAASDPMGAGIENISPESEVLSAESEPQVAATVRAGKKTTPSDVEVRTGDQARAGAAEVQDEKVSRLEQKVITAMQEVMDGQQDNPATGSELAVTELPGASENVPGQQGSVEVDRTSREGRDLAGEDQQLAADHDNQVVNEDSLIKLLEGDARDISEEEIASAGDRTPGKWQLGASLSPLISYRDVASADAAQNVAVNNSESARLTYSGGVGVSYLPTERLAIQTGVYYNRMGVNIGDYSSFKSGWFESSMDMVSAPGRSESVVSISNSMGTVISSDEERFVNNYAGAGTLTDYHMLRPEEMVVADASVESFSQTFEYLEIPFNVRYKIIDRTVDLQIMGGVSTNLMVNNSVAAIAGDETVSIGKVQDVRMFNYSGNAGLGVVYDIFENFSFSIEPRFRYYLNSINTPELPVTRPYTFGFYTGVNYKF